MSSTQLNNEDIDEPEISQISNQSFLTSLDDNELIEFINKLSQKNQSQEPKQSPDPTAQETILDSSILEDLGDAAGVTLSQAVGDGDQADSPQEPSSSKPSSGELQLAQPQEQLINDEEDNSIIFGDYGTYFAAKSRAQQEEDDQYLTWDHQRRVEQGLSPELPELFEGCIIHVNGHTRPGIQTLHKLIILYGVVRPEWITESIEQGKKLKWSDYSVIKVDYGQKRLPFEEQVEDDTTVEEQEQNEDNGEILPLTQEETKPINDVTMDEAIDAKHPDFLKMFFTKSRLHHLSTWKSDLRAEFLTVALNQAKEKKLQKREKPSIKVIMHVDFDCFFATASALKHPEIDFKTTPVCVSHGGNKGNSSADIASCNYVCRKYGVKNGMWVRSAKKLCPELVCLDYDFPTYEKISKQFYNILVDLKPDCVFPVSIDEALLDISSLVDESESVEKSLRHAKPDGQFYLHDDITDFLRDINVRDLPGTGYAIENKLIQEVYPHSTETNHRVTVDDLLKIDKMRLIKIFGMKTGSKLFDYARGNDDTSIDISENPQEFMRKSVSIDVNWGIRLDTIEQVDTFLFNLGKEMSERLAKLNMCALQMTLKILKRAKDAPIEPPKYLGCGKCDALSKSSKFGVPTDEFRSFGTEARSLFRHIGCDPFELRGVSLSVAKLVPKDQVGNQKRLPFKKVDFETFKKQKLENSSPFKDEVTTVKEVKSTQYLIPSDVDSSVLEELPSSIKKDIRHQREKSYEPVPEIPKEVDIEVFNALPIEIQMELKEELRRRRISLNPQTPQKDRKSYLQQVFPVDGSQPEYVRVISPRKSPTKKNPNRASPFKRSPSKSPMKLEKYDEKVLNELPTSLRENIIEEWEAYENANKTEFSKIRENLKALANEQEPDTRKIDELSLEHFEQLSTPLVFQKRKRPREVIGLVEKWILHTKHKGPHSKDLEVYKTYIESLLNQNLVFCLNLIETMTLLIKLDIDGQICEKWVDIIKDLETHVNKYCKDHKYKM
ncbi:unnamed protein product [Wickerhamomyces anomalus]